MWLTSKSPACRRTARCSETTPPNCTGISQPANGTSLPPSSLWSAWSGVRRSDIRAIIGTTANPGGLKLRPGPREGLG